MIDDFVLLDSGNRREFPTGSRRDRGDNKPRPDLISPHALMRVGALMARGAQKYGERNWELGQPTSGFIESLQRHVLKYMMGERDEDHLAAIVYNAQAIIHFEEMAKLGDPVALEMLDAYASKALADQLEEREPIEE